MPISMTRLVLAPCLLAFTWLCYVLIAEIFDRRLGWDDEMALLAADIIMALVFAAGWIGVWRRSVHWNPFRWIATFVSMALAAVLAGIYWSGLTWAHNRVDDFFYVLAFMMWMALWVASTMLLWRESKSERLERMRRLHAGQVFCPQCRYNLTGLRQTKCPECGSEYTLDVLFASMLEERNQAEGL